MVRRLPERPSPRPVAYPRHSRRCRPDRPICQLGTAHCQTRRGSASRHNQEWTELHDAYPETRQGIMIPVRSSIRDSKPPNFASNHTLSLDPRMFGENEPSKAKMTPVTKLFS